MNRRWLTTGALLALAMLGVATLWAMAANGVETSIRARHQDALDRVGDGVAAKLAERVAEEEARSFLEYRYLYVPLDNANPAVVRSPLSKTPVDPAIRGYFTLDPDGSFRTPSDPRGNELELVQQKRWATGPAPDPELEALVRGLPLRGVAARGWTDETRVQQIGTKAYNLSTFSSDANGFVPASDGDRDVTVEVRPFRGFRRGAELVLVREVVAEGKWYYQGLVFDVDRLLGETADAVLGPVGLPVVLDWSGGDPPGAWRRSLRLAPPFDELTVVAAISESPALVGSTRGVVRALGIGVGLLLVLAAAIAARTVQVELAYVRRRSEFVSAVTHELRTPLTAIRMYAEMLRDGIVPEERRHEYLTTVLSESDRLSRLVSNVLTLAALEQGRARPVLIAGDAAAVVREALDIVRPHTAAAGFTLECAAAAGLPAVMLDRDGLLQVVVNLVDNSVKFAAEHERRVVFEVAAAPDGVVLRVRDFGPGVPAAHLPRVFEPFWRGERQLVRKTRGTGIGLSLVSGLVAGMGGTLKAQNAPGGGFVVEIGLRAATA